MSAILHAYLVAWLFALAVSLGSMANLMVHALTGGRWAEPVRGAWMLATRAVPAVAVAFLPIALGVTVVYPWTEDAGRWLNVPFFLARAAAFLVAWSILAVAFARSGAASKKIAAAGLLIYGFTMSIAAVDWIASLDPTWHSSGFGLIVVAGQMLAGAAFGIANAGRGVAAADDATRLRFHDLGNILLMYVLVWAYVAYSEILVIWSENLPAEIHWYAPRLQTGWEGLGFALVAFHFALPLAILLSRDAKRSPRILAGIAAALLVAHFADVVWLVVPSLHA